MEEIKSIRISELKDFKNHPFHVQQDMEMCALMKSIEDEGVIVPLLVITNQYLMKHKLVNPASTMEMWKLREQAKQTAEEEVYETVIYRFY